MRSTARIAAYVTFLAFGLYQSFGPTFDSRFALVQAERGDSMLNHYLLENTWQTLGNPSYPGTFFSPPCFYPEPYTIWYSEHLFGAAPAYWLLRLGLPDHLAYQWWQIVMAGLNFVTFALVARWLGLSFVVTLLGAYLWAFALPHIYQTRHQQLIPRFWMPLAVFYGWSFVLTPSARALNRMFACVFLQCIICMNTGWFLVGGLAVFLPTAVGFLQGGAATIVRFLSQNRLRLALIAAGWGTALAIAFLPYVIVNWGRERTYVDCQSFIPTFASWIASPTGSRWQETIEPYLPPVNEECLLFSGFGLLALMMLAVVRLSGAVSRPDRLPTTALAAAGLFTAAVWFLLTVSPEFGGPSLWQVVRLVPGSTAIRCVSRVYVTVYLFGTLGTLVWLDGVTRPLRPTTRYLVQGIVATLVIFEQTGYRPESFEKPDFYAIADSTACQLRGADAGYVITEYTDRVGHRSTGAYGDILAMWASVYSGVPVVNGYSGRTPGGNYPVGMTVTDDELRDWLRGRFRGKLAIVHPDHPEEKRVIEIE